MAALSIHLSSHMRCFIDLPSDGLILTLRSAQACTCYSASDRGFNFDLHFGGSLIYRFPQGFTRFEMRHTLFRNGHTLTTSRISSHTGRSAVDGEAAKTPDLNPVPTHECIIHGIKDRLDGKFSIAVCELAKAGGQFFNKVRASHVKPKYKTGQSERSSPCPELEPS